MFLKTPTAWSATGGTNPLGVQLSLRKEAIDAVVYRALSEGVAFSAILSLERERQAQQ